MQPNLFLVLIVLLIVLIIKQFLESGYFRTLQNIIEQYNITNNTNNTKQTHDNLTYQKQLNNIITNTQQKINIASEKGYLEAFTNKSSTNTDILPSYLNKTDTVKLQLFYKKNCKYCSNFLSTWTEIINNLPNDATYEEIDCDKDIKKASENKINTVPTFILVLNNDKYTYMGDRSYNDINKFLQLNGVNLIQRQFENFNNGYSNSPSPTNQLNPHCPAVSFDKQIDLINDTYTYQVFNSDGQYGYAVGGYNSDKLLTPFMAAYSTIDSYLSSLPDDNDTTKNSYKNLNECAQIYANNIINFGLCDSDQLNNILGYQSNINNGNNTYRTDNTDYSNNPNIINAIKNVCNITT